MMLYLSFCCFYHKKKAQQRIGDSTHSAAAGGDSRDQRRHDNRAVLDESSNAARNAREDEEMGRILEERKERIGAILDEILSIPRLAEANITQRSLSRSSMTRFTGNILPINHSLLLFLIHNHPFPLFFRKMMMLTF